MKKNIITSMLTVTALTAALSFSNLNILGLNSTVTASAAKATSLTNCTPRVSVQARTAAAVKLKTGCNSKVTGYKIYRTTSPGGKYKCIGSTDSTIYVDKTAKSDKSYYYKVRGYKKVNGVNCTSKASTMAVVTPTLNKASCLKLNATSNSVTKTPTKTPTKAPTQPQTPTKEASNQNYDSSFASQVLKIVNAERTKVGLNELSMPSSLVKPANKRATEIKEVFQHTRPDGTQWSTVLGEYNISAQTAGENIIYGYNTPEAAMKAWMNSPGHRANILNANYNNIGIGVYEVNGTVYCAQLFTN